MAILRNLSLMSFSTGVRLLTGVITLSITARMLGKESFGVLMFFLSVAGLLCIINNFGLGTFLLREIGRSSGESVKFFKETLTAKIVLTVFVFVGVIFALNYHLIKSAIFSFFLIVGALVFEGFTEYFSVGFRACGKFGYEARISLISALFYSVCVGGAAWLTESFFFVTIAYFFSRLVIALFAWQQLSVVMGKIRPAKLEDGLSCLRRTTTYAADSAMGALFGQIDSVVLQYYLGAGAVGVYQAGMRLFMAAIQLAIILSNVFLPRVSSEMARDINRSKSINEIVVVSFMATGVVIGLGFSLIGPIVVITIFGQGFYELKYLMPYFGALFMVRLFAGGWGLLLTADGNQSFRSKMSVAHWFVIAITAIVFVPKYGSAGWLFSLIIGSLLLGGVYFIRASNLINHKLHFCVASLFLLLIFAFFLF